jgi:hypothetical protein
LQGCGEGPATVGAILSNISAVLAVIMLRCNLKGAAAAAQTKMHVVTQGMAQQPWLCVMASAALPNNQLIQLAPAYQLTDDLQLNHRQPLEAVTRCNIAWQQQGAETAVVCDLRHCAVAVRCSRVVTFLQ